MVMESDTGLEPAPTDPGFPDRVVAKAISARHLTGSMGTCGSGFQHWECGTDASSARGGRHEVRIGRHGPVGDENAWTGADSGHRGRAGRRLGPAPGHD